MKTSRIAESMHYLENDLIAEAISEPQSKKAKHWVRWVAVAACLVLLMGTVTAATNPQYVTELLETFIYKPDPDSDYTEYGYVLSAEIKRFSISDFKGAVQEAPSRIRWQMENFPLWTNQLPNTFLKKFSTAAEGQKYLGLESLQSLDWEQEYEEVYTSLNVHGEPNGDMVFLYLETSYRIDGFYIQTFAQIYTEHWKDDVIHYRSIGLQEREFRESFYTTEQQLRCHIITSHNLESGRTGLHGFLVYQGILYTMNITYAEEADATRAEALLHQWANQFGK